MAGAAGAGATPAPSIWAWVGVGAVARTLGVDQPAYRVITVAGTNGKGSTVATLEALLLALGLRVGTLTSPHLLRYNERIHVDGREARDAELVAVFERIEAARGTTTLTFFEYNTLAALLLFADTQVDVAVLEVGLGGRLDAVNLVDADVAVLCSVGFDHRDWLGDTLEAIGAEKAGIFRAHRPVVLGTPQMPASVFAAIERLAAQTVVAERQFTWELDPNGADLRDPRGWTYRGLLGADCRTGRAAPCRSHPVPERCDGAGRRGMPGAAHGPRLALAAADPRAHCRGAGECRGGGALSRSLPGPGGVDTGCLAQRAGGTDSEGESPRLGPSRGATIAVCGILQDNGCRRDRPRAGRFRAGLDRVRAARSARRYGGATGGASGAQHPRDRAGEFGGRGLRSGADFGATR